MVTEKTIVQALVCMWETYTARTRHRAKADAGLQYEMAGDTLSVRKYVGDRDSRTVCTLFLSAGALAGFRRAVAQCEGKSDPEFIDQRLKGMIHASCERYSNAKIRRALGVGLSVGAGVMTIVLLSGKALGEAPLWTWVAGVAVGLLGLGLTFWRWHSLRRLCDMSSCSTEEDVLRALEAMDAKLNRRRQR